DMMHALYTAEHPRPRIAGYSKLVDAAASEGDMVARNIILNAAQQLATLTSAVRSQLFQPEEKASVSYIGGVFRSALLLERYRMLVELEDGNHLHPPLYGPAAGALIEAYRAAGLDVLPIHIPEFEK
ncbi:MAG TPA: hypothetical protein VMZ52_17235, partial [Bryobacteraceae bacterium]|nr:hypothetical protein [Bryobacteraceae bacterium]